MAPREHPDDAGFIRVQADRLDEVINLLGELVIAGKARTPSAPPSSLANTLS